MAIASPCNDPMAPLLSRLTIPCNSTRSIPADRALKTFTSSSSSKRT
jgi:hypothetical protein